MTCLQTTKDFHGIHEVPLAVLILGRTEERGYGWHTEVGGSGEELNKAPILLSTGAGNRTPLSKVRRGVGNSRCGWVFFSLLVTLCNPQTHSPTSYKVLPTSGPIQLRTC